MAGAKTFLLDQSDSRFDGIRNMYTIQGTRHQNFCDVIFWAPRFLLRRVLGEASPFDSYRKVIDLTAEFLLQEELGESSQ